MIIDIHTHLGDILHVNGGDLIYKTGVQKKIGYDVVSQSEFFCHKGFSESVDRWVYNKISSLVAKASRARNATATLENIRQSMDAAGISHSACMPIPPYVTFDDLKKAQQQESRIIPFTGVDFTKQYDMEAALKEDVTNGAKGLKLHPIIQLTPLNSQKTLQVVEAFAVHRLPVLFHCGISSYYPKSERRTKENPTLGEISSAKDLVSSFPDVKFIAGHAGLYEYRDVIDLLGGFKNVMVDTSFQSPGHVRELISVFGPDRVLYASDWPYGNRMPAIKIVKKGCKGDRDVEKQILYENAASLLGM